MGRHNLTYIILFAFRTSVCLPLFFVPIHLRAIGFTGWQIGFLMGIDALMSLLLTLPIGVSNDFLTSRKLIFVSFSVLAPTFALISIASGYMVFLIAFTIMGVCFGLSQVSLKALVFKTTEKNNRGKRLALISSSEHAGIAIGSLAGGLLLMTLSFAAVFQITALLFVAVTPLTLMLSKTTTEVFKPTAYKRELFRRDVLYFSIVTFLFTYHWGAEKTVYALFLKESLGFSTLDIGVFMGVTIGALALSSLLFGRLLDLNLTTMKKLITMGVLLSAGGHLLLALSTTMTQAYVFRIIHELGDSSFMVFFYVMTAMLFKKSRIGGGSGFIAQVSIIATFIGAFTSGALLEHYRPRIPMIAASVFSFCALYFVNKLCNCVEDRAPVRTEITSE